MYSIIVYYPSIGFAHKQGIFDEMVEWLTVTLGDKSTTDDLVLNLLAESPFRIWNYSSVEREEYSPLHDIYLIGTKFRFSHQIDLIHFKFRFSGDWHSSVCESPPVFPFVA